MGGAVALALAATARPDAVTRVVGVASMGAPMPLPPALDGAVGRRPEGDGARAMLDAALPRPRARDRTRRSRGARAAMRGRRRRLRAAVPAAARALGRATSRSAPARSPPSPRRVLLVHGAHDRLTPLRDAALPLLEQLPDARLYVARRAAGTCPRVEQPARVPPCCSPTSWSPMPELAVLRCPAEVLFGARHGGRRRRRRRPARTPRAGDHRSRDRRHGRLSRARARRCARPGSTSRSSPTPPSTSRWR